MRNSRLLAISCLITTCLFVITGYTACIKDTCEGIVCANEGVCVDGICTCTSGFEGYRCNKEWAEKFEGNWQATDKYLNAPADSIFKYELITDGATDSLWILGMLDSIPPVKCNRVSGYTFTMPSQVLDSNITINNGKGTLDVNTGKLTGFINYRHRDTIIQIAGEAKKIDTTVTTYFSWTR